MSTCFQSNITVRDVNRGSKNRNSLQIRLLEIEFSNSKLDITVCISAQAVTQAAGDRASRSAQMARCGVVAQRALSTMTPPQRQGVNLKH